MELDIAIAYTFRSEISECEYEGDFFKKVFFDIFLTDGYLDNEFKIGSGILKLIDLELHNKLTSEDSTCISFWQIADYSAEFLELFNALLLEKIVMRAYCIDDSDFRKSIFKILKQNYFRENVIHLSRLEINKDYQNKKIGSSVINQIKKDFKHFGDFISVKPYPLDCESKLSEDKEGFSEEEYNSKQKKINKFYIKNGFKKVGKSKIYIAPI